MVVQEIKEKLTFKVKIIENEVSQRFTYPSAIY